jgi:hypothetical protein
MKPDETQYLDKDGIDIDPVPNASVTTYAAV